MGLSWHEWVMDPENKKLFEWNRAEARRKYLIDENEYIEQILLQERIIQERIIQETTFEGSIPLALGGGGRTSVDNISSGVGRYSIGTFLNEEGEQVDTAAEAGVTGTSIFVVS